VSEKSSRTSAAPAADALLLSSAAPREWAIAVQVEAEAEAGAGAGAGAEAAAGDEVVGVDGAVGASEHLRDLFRSLDGLGCDVDFAEHDLLASAELDELRRDVQVDALQRDYANRLLLQGWEGLQVLCRSGRSGAFQFLFTPISRPYATLHAGRNKITSVVDEHVE
jgi:hypothetical protein